MIKSIDKSILILIKECYSLILLYLLFDLDFPLDVTIDSFSYEDNIPIVKWQPVETGNCQVKYNLTIANQTGEITKEVIGETSLNISEMTEPTDVRITAIRGSRSGSLSESFEFTKITTTGTKSRVELN